MILTRACRSAVVDNVYIGGIGKNRTKSGMSRPIQEPPGEDIAEDVLIARKIQTVMMPRILPSFEGLELGVATLSGSVPGSDLLDIIRISEDVVAFLMFEVAGAGIRSLLISAMAKICFTNHVRQGVSPLAVIERVHEELVREIESDLHLSAFLGYLDLHDNILTYTNTGSITPQVYRRTTRSIEMLPGCTKTIGYPATGSGGFDEERIYLSQGDCLVVFTDGLYGITGAVPGAVVKDAATGFIIKAMENAGGAQLIDRIRECAAERKTFKNDISVVYAEILTQSRMNQTKVKLGFTTDDVVYMQFLNYLEEMDKVTATILTAMDVAGYPDERIRKMKIVLTELLVNAIVHGNNRDYSRKVVVGHIIDRKKTIISIMDEGAGFDPNDVPDPTLPENLEKPCGRGLFIVRHYVDSIVFNEAGNRVTISTSGETVTE